MRIRMRMPKMPWSASRDTTYHSLDLVYTIPISKSGWLSGTLGPFRKYQTPKNFWVELRGDVVLLYSTAELMKHYSLLQTEISRRHRFTRRDAFRAGLIQDLMDKDKDFIEGLARSIDACHVVKFVLPVTRIQIQEQTLSFTLRESKVATLYTSSAFELEKWHAFLSDALTTASKNLYNFNVKDELGHGAFGTVYQVQDKDTEEKLAFKVIEKKSLQKNRNRYRNALSERRVMEVARGHPFIVDMRYAFQSAERLFLVTEFCPGGDLGHCLDVLYRAGHQIPEQIARVLAAEIVLALEHLHGLGIIYRDLKPENILLDRNGHIRLADFGLSKLLRRKRNGQLMRTNSLVGTPDYIAPEAAWRESYDTSADVWSFGVTLYEILTGAPPLLSRNVGEALHQAKHSPIPFDLDLSPSALQLLRGLLEKDPSRRLGAGKEGLAEVKNHEWFAGIDWNQMEASLTSPGPLMAYCGRRVYCEDHGVPYIDVPAHRRKKIARAKAKLMGDIRKDRRYVFRNLKSEFDEGMEFVTRALSEDNSSDQKLTSLSRRPEAPMGRKGRDIVAGYTFTEYPSRRELHFIHLAFTEE